MHTNIPNHEPGLLLMTCGNTQPIRPSMGSWLTYGLGTENQNLPGFVVMCPGKPVVGPQLWSNSFLPGVFQGCHIRDLDPKKVIDHIRNRTSARTRSAQLDLLNELNALHKDSRAGDDQLDARIQSLEIAYRMQTDAQEAFDVSREPVKVRDAYGKGYFADACLAARRLVERGVRMVQVFYGNGQPWDDHGDVEKGHRTKAKDTDKPIAALLRDLKARGLLDETLVLWGGEFGRTPTSEGRERPRPQQPRLLRVAGRRRGEGRHGLRRDRRVRLRGGGEEGPRPRPARDDPAPDGPRPREADLPLQRPRLPPDRRARRRGEGHPEVAAELGRAIRRVGVHAMSRSDPHWSEPKWVRASVRRDGNHLGSVTTVSYPNRDLTAFPEGIPYFEIVIADLGERHVALLQRFKAALADPLRRFLCHHV